MMDATLGIDSAQLATRVAKALNAEYTKWENYTEGIEKLAQVQFTT